MRRIVAISLLIAVGVAFGFATICHADTDDPDSITAPEFHANRHLAESDDFLIWFTIGINYSSVPDDPINDTFDFVLYDTDGVTVLGSKEAYNFVNSGYGDTVLGFYFDADDAPTWEQSYILNIRGKPTAFTDPPIYEYQVPISAYTGETTQSANRDEVREEIISVCYDLSESMDLALLEQSGSAQVLSDYGEELFRNSIPGLQAMVPELFSLAIYTADYPNLERSWTSNQSANYTGRYDNTPEHSAIDSFWSQMFNVEFNIGAAIPVIVACVIFLIASAKDNNDTFSGIMNCAMAVVISSPWGVVPMAIVAVGALLSSFVVSFKLFKPT